MPLTNTTIKQIKPKEKDFWLSDQKGLRLLVKPNGSKYWRLKYRFAGKQKTLALGVYPDVSLKSARTKTEEARALLSNHQDPSSVKRNRKHLIISTNECTFSDIAEQWFRNEDSNWSAAHSKKQRWIIDRNLIPYLGNYPISDITPPILLAALRKIEDRGVLETARRSKQVAGQIFRFAVASGIIERDPTPNLKGALQTPQSKHYACITEPRQLGKLLFAIETYEGTRTVQNALKLLPLLFVRPGELRHMEWEEIDWQQKVWNIPGSKMKMKQPHAVPLPKQGIAILKDQQLITGHLNLIFPSDRSRTRPMSENAINAALRRMGFTKDEMTAHGFRATARTILDEILEFEPHLIEHQLAHEVKDPLGRAYNRTKHLPQRKNMMQNWADYLEVLATKASNRTSVNEQIS